MIHFYTVIITRAKNGLISEVIDKGNLIYASNFKTN
jgi:hypothetical protein